MMHGEIHKRVLYGKACEQLLLPLIERMFGPVRKGSVEDDYSGVDVYVWGIPMQIKVRYCKTSNFSIHIRKREHTLLMNGKHRAKHFLCFFIHGNKLYFAKIHIQELINGLEETKYGYYSYTPKAIDKCWECNTGVFDALYTLCMEGFSDEIIWQFVESIKSQFLQSFREVPCE